MNIQQLRVIVELSKGKSLIEIGEMLEITQPTVSFHIRKLEEELGMPLYLKEKRNLVLTKACHELVPYARQILELMDEAKQRMQMVQSKTHPRLRITAGHTPATYYLPPYLQLFQRENPHIEVSLSVNQAHKSIQLLRDYQADLAVISLQSFTIEGMNVHPLIEDKLLMAYAPNNRLAALPQITLDDLSGETFLLHEQGSTIRALTDDWAKRTGFLMSNKVEVSSVEAIKDGTKSARGVGILPESSIRSELASGQLLAIPLPNFDYKRCICIAYRNEEHISRQVNSFIWFAIEHMKN